jgi:L-ascorbate metabolism protein UlaG (beta-lactamase superfamily)
MVCRRALTKKRAELLVDIIWHGYSCFEVKGQNATVVFDPFRGIGISEPKAKADIVLYSHGHPDHNNIRPVLKEGGVVLEGFVGAMEVEDVPMRGVATLHDAAGGSQKGENSVYVIQLDGLTLCHLGDVGHELTAEQAKEIATPDVLFTPVAGGATIGPDIAWSVIAKLDPKIIIPMHYNAGLSGASPWLPKVVPISLNEFLGGKKNVERSDGPNLSVEKESLPEEQTIVVPRLPI